MSVFRLLHLSDFHFGYKADAVNVAHDIYNQTRAKTPDVNVVTKINKLSKWALLKPTSHDTFAAFAAAKFCAEQARNYDAIVISGDLAATGNPNDLGVAANYLYSHFPHGYFNSKAEAAIGNVPRRKFILAGNHDRYMNFVGTPGSLEFDSIFAQIVPLGRRVYSSKLTKSKRSIGIVFGDFCLRQMSDVDGNLATKAAWAMGRGNAYPDLIRGMQVETDELRRNSPGIYVFWVIHFAPYECGEELELQNYSEFMLAARTSGINLILCGHTHSKFYGNFDGLHVLCAGTTSSNDYNPKHSIHVVELDFSGPRLKVSRENHVFDRDDVEFVVDGSPERIIN